jgi:hypothetical protein
MYVYMCEFIMEGFYYLKNPFVYLKVTYFKASNHSVDNTQGLDASL